MAVLSTNLRSQLERTVIEAREAAENGAKKALEALAVSHYEPYPHLAPGERKLRNRLRARARQLGDRQDRNGRLEMDRLVAESACEHWHRMLFARFLAENGLLMYPGTAVAISLDECRELARNENADLWTLASRYAETMLPQIFRTDDPILEMRFTGEDRDKLETLLCKIEEEVFKAEDALGWCYQFWQSKRKKEVNRSATKVGADEIASVTQLFTESYMVSFLIENTLGAWWAGNHPGKLPIPMEYLRRWEDGAPAAGSFSGWPPKTSQLRILDPCCGSGHFLSALLHHLVPLRMAEESLTAREAVDAVLRDNLYGLEIDERCTQIAAFALALAAWTYPGTGGYRPLPGLNIACSGIAPHIAEKDWLALAGEDVALQNGMKKLYDLFQDAPILGSLIDPTTALDEGLYEAGFKRLRPLLQKIVARENEDCESREMGVAACGIADAVEILSQKYHLVITNVPYLARGKQAESLKDYLTVHYERSKQDLATAFVERCLNFCKEGGTAALVTPQNWLFLGSYQKMRQALLKEAEWNFVAKLGPGAFKTISGEVVNVMLCSLSQKRVAVGHCFIGLDASAHRRPEEKAKILRGEGELKMVEQRAQLGNVDCVVVSETMQSVALMRNFAKTFQGIKSGDDAQYRRTFWEIDQFKPRWSFFQSTVKKTVVYGGCESIIDWQHRGNNFARFQGVGAWDKIGVAISQMRELCSALFRGNIFDSNVSPIIPHDPAHLLAIWCFCSSPQFHQEVRKIDQKLSVTNATLVKVPFDLAHWQKVAAEKYPGGLPEPYSDDPTQWLFKGTVTPSDAPLQVAVARLLGYRWPQEQPDGLDALSDEDGIVCLPSVRGKEPAAGRLRMVLKAAFGKDWSPAKERELIACGTKDIEEWLRDDFFEGHCKLFHHRPFIWHIWDGRKDGFHALVNYHKLAAEGGKGRRLLESLAYSYLGDWISRRKDAVSRNEESAEDRLVAALELQKYLAAIIEGEPPFDIFVRWKPLAGQPIGWEPDINDGVRVNIRPFMAIDFPRNRKRAGILRFKPNITWTKDRGKEPERPQAEFPWFWNSGRFLGDRVNDVHLDNDKKRTAKL